MELERQKKQFLIVGIGASAGGLDALELFFANLDTVKNIAFVVIQHSDYEDKTHLPSLLSHYTEIPIIEVNEGTEVVPETIYISPSGMNLALINGYLNTIDPQEDISKKLPIDYFLRSLATDWGEYAVAIILSGAGSDGTLGIADIKRNEGLVITQNPQTAKNSSMPESAIATKLVDFILNVEEMPKRLINIYNQSTMLRFKQDNQLSQNEVDTLRRIVVLIRDQTGHNFSQYKINTVRRRIQRRMVVGQLDSMEDYIRYLQVNPLEITTLFHEMLIAVTTFFRDKEAFEVLQREVIPRLFQSRTADEQIRIWVAGCSTGEEAYSIAILIQEYLEEQETDYDVQIFATDLDEFALDKARMAIYPPNIALDVTEERLGKYFVEEDTDKYRVNKMIRNMVIFATHSLIKDPPFSHIDLICCRNVLIYFNSELQEKAVSLFHYALKPMGYLFLGTSETLAQHETLFEIFNLKAKIYECTIERPNSDRQLSFSHVKLLGDYPSSQNKTSQKLGSLRNDIEQLLLERYAPSTVVINEQADVIYVQNRTGHYLEITTGEVHVNILEMAREGLKIPLAKAIREALTKRQRITHTNIRVRTNGDFQTINLHVELIMNMSQLNGLLVVTFEEVDVPLDSSDKDTEWTHSAERKRIRQLEDELLSTKEYLSTTIEELETANEELKSINEELQSSNEELQSTNEELEAAKEELQSVNEENITVNSELENRIEELPNPDEETLQFDTDTEADSRDQRLIQLDQELQSTREYLQTMIEELEASNEELKSTNEELQSSNEKLQSTNEELETAKEELQSINEELMSVNAELTQKIDELSDANNDVNNLLASVGIGVLFLDLDLNVQRYNPMAGKIVNLIETDIGRPLKHLVTNLKDDSLAEDASKILETLAPIEKEMQSEDNRWYRVQVRPYRTTNNAINGVVITFRDITEYKELA